MININNKVVLIIGATGGLGRALVDAFTKEGSLLILAGRNIEKLIYLPDSHIHPLMIETVDITKMDSINSLFERIKEGYGSIDILVNAAGLDIRKKLIDQEDEDIVRQLDVDLLGPIMITKRALFYMRKDSDNFIVHIGGFGDGRLAFPYYSVDVSARAGLFSFIESMNRELALENSRTRLFYFSPSPAETDTEKPYLPLWRKMGMEIVTPEKVAETLLTSIKKKRIIGIMGGFLAIIFIKLNAALPELANFLLMNSYGRTIRNFLYDFKDGEVKNEKGNLGNIQTLIAILLVALSFILYGMIAIVPFLPFNLSQKAMSISVLVLAGELSWWIGIALAGKQLIDKYRKFINPCTWFTCLK
jgi:short-subunit dehydrogenase